MSTSYQTWWASRQIWRQAFAIAKTILIVKMTTVIIRVSNLRDSWYVIGTFFFIINISVNNIMNSDQWVFIWLIVLFAFEFHGEPSFAFFQGNRWYFVISIFSFELYWILFKNNFIKFITLVRHIMHLRPIMFIALMRPITPN